VMLLLDIVRCDLMQVGAEIVLADRDQGTTLRRLSRAALLYQQRPGTLPIASEIAVIYLLYAAVVNLENPAAESGGS
jgi:hypothetical protein